MLFRLKKKVGKHEDETGKVYSAGDYIKSDSDLEKKFRGKFEKVQDPDDIKRITRRMKKVEEDGPAIPEPKAKKTSKKDKKSKKTSKPKAHPEYGKDVTKDFEDAGTLGLKVYEKNKWFNIFDPETEEVLNGKNLRKKFVASFLAEYSIEEDEVEDDDEDEDEDEDEVEDDEVEDDDDDEEDDE